ncbi:uncharacterized protein LOC124377842 [Silurus meridionalis]|uniref:Interferon-induced protein 44-like n=1 Tax=Silurus meridionalis TaxID=175797 RepID=A0A8T0AEG6_SILME|nr:uncharacterized protein LOC124377842 [Silurus meridionalis]KAF7689773.1 hypothetical protein HF521_013126 [Silurus meridionalis]
MLFKEESPHFLLLVQLGERVSQKNTKPVPLKEKMGHLCLSFSMMLWDWKQVMLAHSQDIINALRGFLQEGYDFENKSTECMNSPGYRSNPSLDDQIYCLVNIMAANTVTQMSSEVIRKMRSIREAAARLDIPQAIIMTKPDLACPLVHGDLRKIYTSKKIKEKMEVCRNLVGVPMNHIFPVKNYHEEMDTNNDMDALILKALDQIVNIAYDAMKKKAPNSHDES